MSNELLIGLLCLMCVLFGLVLGLCLARVTVRGKAGGPVSRPYDAPIPAVDLGYDPENPMNAGRKQEAVEMCGATWYRM